MASKSADHPIIKSNQNKLKASLKWPVFSSFQGTIQIQYFPRDPSNHQKFFEKLRQQKKNAHLKGEDELLLFLTGRHYGDFS